MCNRHGFSVVDLSLNGQQYEAPTHFYYHAPPVVASVEPTSGPTAGGTPIALHGDYLVLPEHV